MKKIVGDAFAEVIREGDRIINIKVISTSEIKISVLINKKDSKKALAALHKEFKLDK